MRRIPNLSKRDADALWVVMDKEQSTVLADPGLGRPFSTKFKNQAERIARETGGVAVPYKDALVKVMKHPKNGKN